MVKLAPADFVVLGAFFAVLLTLGFSARIKENTSLQLVAAGRKLTLPLFLATLVTTWYGGVLGSGELFQNYGLANLTINGLPYWAFGIAFVFLMARRVRQEEQISIPERLERCYGKKAGLLSAVLVMLLATPAPYILMLGTLLSSFVPSFQLLPCIAASAIIATLFLYRGGLLADARSNIISFVAMYAGFIIILVVAIAKYGPPGAILAKLPPDHRTWDALKGLPWVASWFLIGSWTFIDPGFHQRVAAAGDPQLARRGVAMAVVFWIIFDSLTTLTAMYAYHAFNLTGAEGPGLNIFPLFGAQLLPVGLRGIFFAGMFGAILSATVGYTFVSGSTIGRDLFSRLKPKASEAEQTLYTRIGIAIATAVAILIASWAKSIVPLWYDLPSIIIPGLIVPVIGAYATRKRPNPTVTLLCMFAGTLSALAWYVGIKANYISGTLDKEPIIVGLIVVALIWGIGSAITRGRTAEWKTK